MMQIRTLMQKLRSAISPSRDHSPPCEPDGETETWHIGDRAECIYVGFWRNAWGIRLTHGPRKGQVLIVRAIVIGPKHVFLRFDAFQPLIFASKAFRKRRPRETAADAEFTAQIRACAPAGSDPVEHPAQPFLPQKMPACEGCAGWEPCAR
jgi:hypothetical protein